MPIPYHENAGRRGDPRRLVVTMTRPMLTGRRETEAEGCRRRRHGGYRADPNAPSPVWQEPPSKFLALPFKPYVYQGKGYDSLTRRGTGKRGPDEKP